jgi:hypothetical protein
LVLFKENVKEWSVRTLFMKNQWISAFLVFAVLCVARSSHAGSAITFSQTPSNGSISEPMTLGWQFEVLAPIYVTSLGIWDFQENGLLNSHEVGIFDTSSSLLVSAIVPSGTSAPLVGPDGFRYVTLDTPFLLSASTYRIGATYSGASDDRQAFNAGPVGAPGFIQYRGGRFISGSALQDPISTAGTSGSIFGPNFQFTPVPEPSSLVSIGLGMVAITGYSVWSRRKPRGQVS